MGNCQAVETATTVIQRPDGKLERVYSTVTASEVLSLILATTSLFSSPLTYLTVAVSALLESNYFDLLIVSCSPMSVGSSVRKGSHQFICSASLLLTMCVCFYLNIELMKGLRAKKSEKMKKIHGEVSVAEEEISPLTLRSESAFDKYIQISVHEKQRETMNAIATNKLRAWQPSLQSISEFIALCVSFHF
ncbi:hypothetical protein IGI04_033578 [Brassica rapa subsp. trilocularis]|uniref:Uncharacterized protein n=1 Tax=Brassica rapa subsp. trilocularis TaxID=1813537 RepID=A0ABQ7L9K4_BRACM|nr:hypothetical protein IGI04_033578 [Brassica rapa subsp. trilocularis]